MKSSNQIVRVIVNWLLVAGTVSAIASFYLALKNFENSQNAFWGGVFEGSCVMAIVGALGWSALTFEELLNTARRIWSVSRPVAAVAFVAMLGLAWQSVTFIQRWPDGYPAYLRWCLILIVLVFGCSMILKVAQLACSQRR